MNTLSQSNIATNSPDSCGNSFEPRISRKRRAAIAKQLLQRLQLVDNAEAEKLMSLMTWELLDQMPLWCTLDEKSVQEVKHIAAALYLGPTIRNSIDGTFLSQCRELLGELLFNSIINEPTLEHSSITCMSNELTNETLTEIGSSILVASLGEHPATRFYSDSAESDIDGLSFNLAVQLSNKAHALVLDFATTNVSEASLATPEDLPENDQIQWNSTEAVA